MIVNVNKIEDGVCLKCGRHRSDMFEMKCIETSMIFCITCFKQEFSHYSVIDTASSGWKHWYAVYMETRKICPNCGEVLDNTIQICTKCTYEYKMKKKMDERIDKIRNGSFWKLGWNIKISKAIFMDLMEKLDGYGIPEEEVDDILSIALHAAINEGKQR